MFTGLIEDVGEFKRRTRSAGGWKMTVTTELPVRDIAAGDSVAVNGACLTVEEIHETAHELIFHTLDETLDRTNLGLLKSGDGVNLERAMAAGGRFGGHFVSGHVDTVAGLHAVKHAGDDIEVKIELPTALAPLVIAKGSITVNGISLTVAGLDEGWFAVRVIPHTWKRTNLRAARAGDKVNLEADMIGKYVARLAQHSATPALTLDLLRTSGFLD